MRPPSSSPSVVFGGERGNSAVGQIANTGRFNPSVEHTADVTLEWINHDFNLKTNVIFSYCNCNHLNLASTKDLCGCLDFEEYWIMVYKA